MMSSWRLTMLQLAAVLSLDAVADQLELQWLVKLQV
jgi:hypothetical protein